MGHSRIGAWGQGHRDIGIVLARWTATEWLVPQDICLLRTNRSTGHRPRASLMRPCAYAPLSPCPLSPCAFYRAGLKRNRPSAAGRSAPVHAVPPGCQESFLKASTRRPRSRRAPFGSPATPFRRAGASSTSRGVSACGSRCWPRTESASGSSPRTGRRDSPPPRRPPDRELSR